jgi:hypothetical protein
MRITLCILLIVGLALGLAAKPTAPKNEGKDDTEVDVDGLFDYVSCAAF